MMRSWYYFPQCLHNEREPDVEPDEEPDVGFKHKKLDLKSSERQSITKALANT